MKQQEKLPAFRQMQIQKKKKNYKTPQTRLGMAAHSCSPGYSWNWVEGLLEARLYKQTKQSS